MTDDTPAERARFARLTIARDQLEAEIVCSMLRAEGIHCVHRVSDMGIGGVMPGKAGAVGTVVLGGAALPGEVMRGAGGPREILVAEDRLAEATELLQASDDVDFEPYFDDGPGAG